MRFAGETLLRIEQSSNPNYSVGSSVEVRFRQGEEAHAVCPIKLIAGKTCLLYSFNASRPLEKSPFDWLNVSSSHERFNTYVQDLIAAHTR